MSPLPKFLEPQLSQLVDRPPTGAGWVHELKYDGYRMAARLNGGKVQLLTRSGLDWTDKYPSIAKAFSKVAAKDAYIDGELCAVNRAGATSFASMQAATDGEGKASLVYFAFDLLHAEGQDLRASPLKDRKTALKALLKKAPAVIKYSDHIEGNGEAFHAKACEAMAEGIMCKRLDAPYASGNRGVWVKVKCHQRAEFVVVGYSNPEGSRSHFGSLLLGYYNDAGKLLYAGRVGTGFSVKKLAEIHKELTAYETNKMPLDVPPPRKTRFGSPLILSQVHWLKPKLVAEVRFLSWTGDGC